MFICLLSSAMKVHTNFHLCFPFRLLLVSSDHFSISSLFHLYSATCEVFFLFPLTAYLTLWWERLPFRQVQFICSIAGVVGRESSSPRILKASNLCLSKLLFQDFSHKNNLIQLFLIRS